MKISKFIKFIPKKLAAAFAVFAIIAVPAFIWAASGPERPTFTMSNPASFVTFNSITDNPRYNSGSGDERNFLTCGLSGAATGSDNINVTGDQEYLCQIYVHNNAAANLNMIAENVRSWASIPSGNATSKTVQATIFSSNATPKSVYDDVKFTSAKNFTLTFVDGSASYSNNKGNFALSSSEFANGAGATLGYETMNGKIPGCYNYSGFLTFKVKAKVDVPKVPAYDVIKTVDKATAKPGDTIKYTITAKNTGQVDLTNVKINDTLPAYYQSASEQINAPSTVSGSIINAPHTVTIAKLPVGTEATITITYKIKGETAFECGKNTRIKNVVTSSTDQDNTEDRTDNNEANTDVTYECPPAKTPSYDLVKTVDKATAKPGDTLTYTLKFTNTGQVDLTNVIIKDQLPAGINWTNVDINVQNGSGISDKDKLFDSGVKIASVKVGGTVTIKITAKVANNAVEAKECGENKATFVNKAESKTDQKADQADNKDEDNPNNNSAETVVIVNKDCNTKYDLEKTVDKKTAKPGETVTYTLTFKNTGDQTLTNVVVKDMLPGGVTHVKDSTTVDGKKADDGVTTANGLSIGTVAAGKTVVIKFQAKMPILDNLVCGENKLVNKSVAVTKEKQTEDRTDNNDATTTVDKECQPPKDRCEIPGKGHLSKDDPACKPDEKPKCDIAGKEHLDKNDPNCAVATIVTPPPVNPPSEGKGGYTPVEIVATGPVEAIAGIIAAGALTFGGAAYIRSRNAVRKNLLNR